LAFVAEISEEPGEFHFGASSLKAAVHRRFDQTLRFDTLLSSQLFGLANLPDLC